MYHIYKYKVDRNRFTASRHAPAPRPAGAADRWPASAWP